MGLYNNFEKKSGWMLPSEFFSSSNPKISQVAPSKILFRVQIKRPTEILWQFVNVFSLFVYLFYKPPALFATCKVTRILSLPTHSILIPAQISMIWHNIMHCSVCLMKSFKSADPEYFIIERQLSKINVTSTIYWSCVLKSRGS